MPRIAHALVTGASSGLGREMVRQLVQDRGVTVLATARRLDRLEQLAAELPPGRVHVLAGNL
ncbi:MAG: SDR family NAD(P)-dependent oxidoreductase, partial [Isosphaeraceae bacterium]